MPCVLLRLHSSRAMQSNQQELWTRQEVNGNWSNQTWSVCLILLTKDPVWLVEERCSGSPFCSHLWSSVLKLSFLKTCSLLCYTGLSAVMPLSEKWQFGLNGNRKRYIYLKGADDLVSLTTPLWTGLLVDSKLIWNTMQINCGLCSVKLSEPQNSPLAPFRKTFSIKSSKIYIFMALSLEILSFSGFIRDHFWMWHFCDVAAVIKAPHRGFNFITGDLKQL